MATQKAVVHHIIERIERASHGWNKGIVVFASICIIGTMMLVVSDVSGRYLFNRPIRGGVEVEQIMLAFISFIGLAYGLIKGTHVRVTLLFNRLPQRLKLGAEIFFGIGGFVLFALVTWAGIEQFWESWVVREIMPASVKLPFWLPKLALPLGALLITIQFIIYILRHLYTLLSKRGEG